MSHLYPVIMAGGGGTRLWPYSRQKLPKQLQRLTGELTMLQATFARAASVADTDRIYVVTNREYVADVRDQLPEAVGEQVVGEPAGLGTAPAVALAAALVRARDESGILACLPADHIIAPTEGFRDTMAAAHRAADRGRIAVIGVQPTAPDTGYGYIELAESDPEHDWSEVARFREKPDRATAERYVSDGRHLWNAGMFVWSVETVFEEYATHLPELARRMEAMVVARRAGTLGERLPEIWASITDRTTLDYGIMEKSSRTVCVPAQFQWTDVGTWDALGDLIPADAEGNRVEGAHLAHDTEACIVFAPSGRTVALIGMRDVVVVDTDDVVLVCPRDRAQDVRHLVKVLKDQGSDLL